MTAQESQGWRNWLLPCDSTGSHIVSTALFLNLNLSFLTGFRYFSYQAATQYCPREAEWTPIQTLYFQKYF